VEEQTDLDLLKLRLEERRVDGELRLREAEFVLKRDEFEAKKIQENQKQYLTVSPLVAGIIAAIVGLIGTAIGSYMQGRSQLETERLKFESNLILKAIETGDREKAKNNLLFMLNAGFIQDKDGKVSALAKQSKNVPVLPSASLRQESDWNCYLYSQENQGVGKVKIWWGHTAGDATWACNNWLSKCGSLGGCFAKSDQDPQERKGGETP
jgi:hypothetical protein